MPVQFHATIYQKGLGTRIDVPDEVSAAFADPGYVPVRGTMNGVGIRGTLMPAGGGRHILNINVEMRRRCHVSVEDSVLFVLDRGEATRYPPMSRELAMMLERDTQAKRTWEMVEPAKRKDVLIKLDKQRSPDAERKEVVRLVERLHNGRF
jgi:hypothetical protein